MLLLFGEQRLSLPSTIMDAQKIQTGHAAGHFFQNILSQSEQSKRTSLTSAQAWGTIILHFHNPVFCGDRPNGTQCRQLCDERFFPFASGSSWRLDGSAWRIAQTVRGRSCVPCRFFCPPPAE